MSKRLTGNKRIVQDCCIDLYNSVQKWISSTKDAHYVIISICMIKQKELSLQEVDQQEHLEDDSMIDTVTSELMQLSSQLLVKLKNLELVVDKMKKITKKLKSVCELSDLEQSRNSNPDSYLDPILFQCWPLSRFYEFSEEIEKMHTKDLKIKLNIASELCILTKKSQLTFFEAYWKYEPDIDRDRVDELLDGIICEMELFSQLS